MVPAVRGRSGCGSARSSTASSTRSSATHRSRRSRSTGRRSCSRTTSRCGRRTRDGCRRCSTPAVSRSARRTSCRTRSSWAASRSSATSCSAAASAGASESSRAAPATSPTASAIRRSCRRSWRASASAPSSSRAGWATSSTTSGVVFRWRAGPAEVVACQMLPHYDNFARLGWYHDAEERVRAIVGRFGELLQGAGQDEIVLADGSDHEPIEPELPEILGGLEKTFGARFRIGRYDEHTPAPDGLPVLRGRARRWPAPEHPARRQLGADLPQAGERSARNSGCSRSRRRPRCRPCARARRTPRPSCGWRGETCSATTRTTRSAAARATRCTATCSSATSSSTGRSTSSGAEALGVGAALVNTLPYRRRRLVDGELFELDGFSGARPEPFRSRGPLINYDRIAELHRLRGRAGRRRPVHVLSRRHGPHGEARRQATAGSSSTSCRASGSRRRSATWRRFPSATS